jgi:hypothetical protein
MRQLFSAVVFARSKAQNDERSSLCSATADASVVMLVEMPMFARSFVGVMMSVHHRENTLRGGTRGEALSDAC